MVKDRARIVCSRGSSKLNTDEFKRLIDAQASLKAGRFTSGDILNIVIGLHGDGGVLTLSTLLGQTHDFLTKRVSEEGMGFKYEPGTSVAPDMYIDPKYGWQQH